MKLKSGWAMALLAHPELLILDTETTDLSGYVMQIAVLRARDGAVLLDTLINPHAPINAAAFDVHGITAEKVADSPVFADIEPQLRELLHGKPVAIYNAGFDTGILNNELLRLGQTQQGKWEWIDWWMGQVWWIDVMHPYSEFVSEPGRSGYRWQRLPGGDHTALGDCRAALAALKEMAASEEAVQSDENSRRMLERMEQPAYIAYCRTCGGMAGASVDEVERATDVAQFVYECVGGGLIVERRTTAEANHAEWCDCGLLFAAGKAVKP